jgi:hypothetical protein
MLCIDGCELELELENTSGISGLEGLLAEDDEMDVPEAAELDPRTGELDSWLVDESDVLSFFSCLRYAICRAGVDGSLRSNVGF